MLDNLQDQFGGCRGKLQVATSAAKNRSYLWGGKLLIATNAAGIFLRAVYV
ncbi:MAG: hypothetical protein PHH38_06910 [Candidatus Cloacimonetes bacterium]|nr:hypothetical protein [Candidatus Cloacimonadota bacterium]